MKLIVITAIVAFEKEIQEMLKVTNITSYTYQQVTGFSNNSEEAIESNWFASDKKENESIMYYAFVKEATVGVLFDAIAKHNAEQDFITKIHIAALAVEKIN